MEKEAIYRELCMEGNKKEPDIQRMAYLLGAVDALRIFCDLSVPEEILKENP